MAYYSPQLQIYQEFQAAVAAGATPLYSCIIGPLYELHRYSETDEQALLGAYDRDLGGTYSWTDHVAGGIIDLATAEVIIEDAVLRYYQGTDDVEVLVSNSNQLYSAGVIFKTNSFAARDPLAFGTRDVAAGDLVNLTWVDPVTLITQSFDSVVASLVADVVAGTTNPTNVRVTGFGSTGPAGTTELSTPPTRLTAAYVAAAYDGLVDGYPLDVYTIQVTQVGYAGAGGLDGTVVKITSAGGDTEANPVLGSASAPWGGAFYTIALGTRGAVLRLSDSGALDALTIGAYWQVSVYMLYTEVVVTNPAQFDSTGPYTGAVNTQYIVTIDRGGTVGTDDLVVSYTTNNGADSAGQIIVEAADFPPVQNDYAIGSNGMELSFFDTTQWNTGDVLVFDVLAPSAGAIHTLVLKDAIPVLLGIDMSLSLFVVRDASFTSTYATLTSTNIVIAASAFVSDNILGVTEPFPVFGGNMYIDYREMRTDTANVLGSIDEIGDVDDTLGPVTPLNPLAYGVYKAMLNSGGNAVYYMAIGSDDYDGYEDALGVTTENDDIYGLALLTELATVKTLLRAHVVERSDEDNNQWRCAWVTNPTLNIQSVYDELASGADILATVTEYSPSSYRLVTASGALFDTNSVRAGDVVRINYATDSEGTVTYDSYVIDRVTGEGTLILLTGPSAPISVAVKIEIWRTLTKSEYATSLGQYPIAFGHRRVKVVWADGLETSVGAAEPLYYMCAALAGQRSGVAPHAPLSEVAVLGFYMDQVQKFSRTQLNTVAAGGNWIINKDFDGRIYTRHQVTSAIAVPAYADDLLQREDTFTSNTDHISRDYYSNTRDLFGQGNVSPEMLALIRQRIWTRTEYIRNQVYSAKLGPQIIDAEIVELRIHPTLRDTVDVELDLELPPPLNRLRIHLNISSA